MSFWRSKGALGVSVATSIWCRDLDWPEWCRDTLLVSRQCGTGTSDLGHDQSWIWKGGSSGHGLELMSRHG